MINELVKCYTWSKVSYGADTWALGEDDRIYLESYEMCCWRKKELVWTDSNKSDEVLHGVKGERDILHTRKKETTNFIGHILHRNCLLKCVTEGKIKSTGRRGRKRKPLFHDPTEKSKGNGNWKRKHLIALSGDLVLEEAKKLSQDGLRDDAVHHTVVALLHYSVFRKRHRNMKQAVTCRRPERDATIQSSYLMTDWMWLQSHD